ncbi:hypothetical protein Droror1_Dr00024173, partial [Drosera rotundifolia]
MMTRSGSGGARRWKRWRWLWLVKGGVMMARSGGGGGRRWKTCATVGGEEIVDSVNA